MAEFHEVECPDQIGRVAGFGRSASTQIKKVPPTFVGEESLRKDFSSQLLLLLLKCCSLLLLLLKLWVLNRVGNTGSECRRRFVLRLLLSLSSDSNTSIL